jgi:hypothetical protein
MTRYAFDLTVSDWTKAACIGNTALFHKDWDGGTGEAEAKRICAGCSLRRPCLAEALEQESRPDSTRPYLVRGALTARERHQMIHRKAN